MGDLEYQPGLAFPSDKRERPYGLERESSKSPRSDQEYDSLPLSDPPSTPARLRSGGEEIIGEISNCKERIILVGVTFSLLEGVWLELTQELVNAVDPGYQSR